MIRRRLAGASELAALLPLYDEVIPQLETAMWESALDPARVEQYHALFAEMEGHIAAAGKDLRHVRETVCLAQEVGCRMARR